MLIFTPVRTRALLRTLRLDHLPQVSLPLLDLYLPLALPAGGGGARVATLAFCARIRTSDQAGPGPLLCSGSDLDLLGMKVSKAAERALASLNFSTSVSTEVPKNSEGEIGALRRKPLSFFSRSAKFTHRCLSVTTMAAMDLPIAGQPAWWHGGPNPWCGAAQLPRQVTSPDRYTGLSADPPGTPGAPL